MSAAARRDDRRYPSELDFQTSVVEVAKLAGWRVAHFRSAPPSGWLLARADSYDAHGWPDLTLVRPPRLVFAELKSHTGKPTERQLEWLDVLRLVPGVEVYLWNPADWHSLVELLTGRGAHERSPDTRRRGSPIPTRSSPDRSPRLGLERRAVDAVFRALPVVVLPGYSRPLVGSPTTWR